MKLRGLIFANLLRKKLRLVLTIGCFAVALFLFGFLSVVKSAFSVSANAQAAGAGRLIVTGRVGLIQPLPFSYRDRLLRIPGVKAVGMKNWFGGIYQTERNVFPQLAVDVDTQRQVYPELAVPDDQWQNFVKDRQGAIAGAATAKRFGWKVGDRIPIKNSLYGPTRTWEFNLDGIYHSEVVGGDESQFWFQWKYFDESVSSPGMGHQVGWYIVKLDNPADADRVAKAIDMEFANSSDETKSATESAFQASFLKQLGNIELIMVTIGVVVFFTLLFVTGNTMAMSVRERISELAVMKAIGFSDRAVLQLVVQESLAIAITGGLLGLVLAQLAVPLLSKALGSLVPRALILSPAVLAAGLVVALLVGAVSGLVPGVGVMRMRVISALRRV
jgi:putative ABC transport system permease protein